MVVQNALFFRKIVVPEIPVPWCTFTEPQIAHVGKTERQLRDAKVEYTTYRREYAGLDRAICDSAKGFLKIHVKKGSDTILGATFVGGPAGDMIQQITVAMHNGVGLSKAANMVSIYPTYADGIKGLTD